MLIYLLADPPPTLLNAPPDVFAYGLWSPRHRRAVCNTLAYCEAAEICSLEAELSTHERDMCLHVDPNLVLQHANPGKYRPTTSRPFSPS
jgi:hypothetical protein